MADVRELTRDEFLAISKGLPHNDGETHLADRAVCHWIIEGVRYEEHQPDIGGCKWYEIANIN